MKGIWDFGRLIFSFGMAFTGLFLLRMLFLHGAKLSLALNILATLPFIVAAYFLWILLFKVFMGFRVKCKTEWDFWMIMLSFSLAGMFIMPVRKLVFHLLGITSQTPLWVKILVYIPLIPPTYYVGLLIIGSILGQSQFFLGMIAARLRFLTGKKK